MRLRSGSQPHEPEEFVLAHLLGVLEGVHLAPVLAGGGTVSVLVLVPGAVDVCEQGPVASVREDHVGPIERLREGVVPREGEAALDEGAGGAVADFHGFVPPVVVVPGGRGFSGEGFKKSNLQPT